MAFNISVQIEFKLGCDILKKLNQLNKKKILLGFVSLIIILFIGLYVMNTIEPSYYDRPNYEKIDISPILLKDKLSEVDYKILFYQTGLGKVAIDEIITKKDTAIIDILKFQDDFFEINNVLCERSSIITKTESIVDYKGEYKYGFNLAPYENGYILITKSSHSLGWRHGHSAIITDAVNGYALEAVALGQNSESKDINDWRVYPSFIMLKLKDTSQETLSEIASFAKDNMNDIPYTLTVGLFNKKNPDIENLKSTHCAHLVWYSFKQFDYDIDSNGSLLITPKDIANSDLFEIVQIYGIDPGDIWP